MPKYPFWPRQRPDFWDNSIANVDLKLIFNEKSRVLSVFLKIALILQKI